MSLSRSLTKGKVIDHSVRGSWKGPRPGPVKRVGMSWGRTVTAQREGSGQHGPKPRETQL